MRDVESGRTLPEDNTDLELFFSKDIPATFRLKKNQHMVVPAHRSCCTDLGYFAPLFQGKIPN